MCNEIFELDAILKNLIKDFRNLEGKVNSLAFKYEELFTLYNNVEQYIFNNGGK